MTKLSVVIPAFNAEKSIDYCLNSLIDERLCESRDYEIICVNDGSTDSTLTILNSWESRFPEIIKIITTQNNGLPSARNIGLNNAKGEWIFFCDSDDYIANGALHSLLEYFDTTHEALTAIRFGMKHIQGVGGGISPDDFTGVKSIKFIGTSRDFFLKYQFWTAWIFMYNRDYLITNNLLFRDVLALEDTLFNVEFLLSGNFTIAYLDADVYRYVSNPTSFCHTLDDPEKNIRIFQSQIIGYSIYDEYAKRFLNDAEVHTRIKWVVAKNLPNIFTRLIRSKLNYSDVCEVKKQLLRVNAIPVKVYTGWRNMVRQVILFCPFVLVTLLKIRKIVYDFRKKINKHSNTML